MKLTGNVSSNLYANENQSQTPEWIAETNFQIIQKPTLDIEFDNRTIANEKIKVNRDTRNYNSKKLTAKLNDNEIMLSKIELSKFLGNKHYTIKQANKTNTNITLEVNINNTPGIFNFKYDINNNHIVQSKCFTYNDTEYPFNKAGFEECLEDIKKDKKTTQKVENDTASIITTEEIYRRYNGHIRKATDRIKELLKEEAIIGVGSNKFGTYYDIDYLFPQEDKETLEKEPTFEFVQNLEKIAATPKKSAYQLAMEASKMLEYNFDDFKIVDYKRNNDTLTVQAKVLKNNVSKLQIFDFDIMNENIINKEVNADFKGNNYTKKHNKYISEQNIINKQTVADILIKNGYIYANIDDIFNTLKANKTIIQVDNNNYISQYTIEEILSKCGDMLGQQDIKTYNKLTDKTKDLKLSKQNIKDTGVREEFEHKSARKLAVEASKYLNVFDDFEVLDVLRKNNKLVLKANILKNNVEKVQLFSFDIKNEHIIPLKINTDDINSFYTKRYAKRLNNNNIITKQMLKDVLTQNGYIYADIDDVFKTLKANKTITQINDKQYISNNSLEIIISNNLDLFGKQDIEVYNMLTNKTSNLKLNKQSIKDTGVREEFEHKSAQRLAVEASKYLNVFDDFEVLDVLRKNNKLVLKANILKNNVEKVQLFSFDIKNEHIIPLKINTDDMNSFYTKRYAKRLNKNSIITKQMFKDILIQNGYIYANIDDIFNTLKANKTITQINDKQYTSNNNLETIVASNVDLFGKQDIEVYNMLTNKGQNLKFSKENIKDTGVREQQIHKSVYQYTIEASKQLQKNFDDFDIMDYKLNNNKLFVKAKVLKNNVIKIGTFGFVIKNNKVQEKTFKDIVGSSEIGTNTKFNDKNIISKKYINNYLKNEGYFNYDIDNVFNTLADNNIVTQINNNHYASKYNINQLLKYAHNLIGIQNKQKLSNLIDKNKKFNKIQEKDNGVRKLKAYITNETIINAVNKYLLQYFDNFNVVDFTINTVDDYQSVEYNIDVFNNDTGLSLNIQLTLIIKDNIITNCNAIINGEQFSLNDINNALSISDSLNNYLEVFKDKQVKSDIVFSKRELQNKLQRVAHLNNIDETLELLKKKNYITEIGLDKYASKYTIAELINNSNLKALTKDEINNIIKKMQTNKNILTANYLNDNDTRDMIDVWTPDECRIHISNQISKYFKHYEILNIQIDKDKFLVTINGTDDDGLNKSMLIYFDIDKNHPNEIVNIIKPNTNEAVTEYLNYNNANVYNNKGIITQKQLEQSLLNVVDIKDFDDILQMLIDDDIIICLSNNQYQLNNTMSEIVGYINNKNKTNITANKNRLQSAVRAYDITDVRQSKETDTRNIKQEQSLTLAGKVARKHLVNDLMTAYSNKQITSNKYNELLEKCKTATNERILDSVFNELNKYLK